jgi:hypothetical protein
VYYFQSDGVRMCVNISIEEIECALVDKVRCERLDAPTLTLEERVQVDDRRKNEDVYLCTCVHEEPAHVCMIDRLPIRIRHNIQTDG